MTDKEKNNTSIGEPVEGQAPTPATTSETQPTPAVNETVPATSPAPDSTPPTSVSLPAGYLANGSMVDAEGIMLPEYIGEYAQELAESLKPISASTFQRAFLTKAKEANKKKVPYSAKKNCAQGMVIQAKKLISRKKDPAPAVLLEMVKQVAATVVDDATFNVLYMHLDAIYTNLLVG